jgi:hypothetical protein
MKAIEIARSILNRILLMSESGSPKGFSMANVTVYRTINKNTTIVQNLL